jgi:hypothetical protein
MSRLELRRGVEDQSEILEKGSWHLISGDKKPC